MAETLYILNNASQATTAAPVSQPTGSAIRTMLQLEAGTKRLSIVEWGISFDGSAAATPIKVELFSTSVAATMSTASVAADVSNSASFTDKNAEGTTATFGGTAHTGFATGAVTEGTVANYSLFDLQLIAPTAQYVKQFPLGREPVVAKGTGQFARIRVTAGATVNCYCYIVWSE